MTKPVEFTAYVCGTVMADRLPVRVTGDGIGPFVVHRSIMRDEWGDFVAKGPLWVVSHAQSGFLATRRGFTDHEAAVAFAQRVNRRFGRDFRDCRVSRSGPVRWVKKPRRLGEIAAYVTNLERKLRGAA